MHNLPGYRINELFVKGELSAQEIVDHSLSRIDSIDSQVGAFLALFSERARQKAKDLDEKRRAKKPLGKLAGIPIAIKDNIHILGEKTTCASKFLANYRAVFDATVTRLLEEEDAILIGKTNLDEFAMGSSTENSAYQLTKNPWNLKCSPGGSSGGSAAAVSARFCPIALGSDTGGSIRQPAALTGILGFKPTYGRVSRFGLVAFASSLDQIGPFATSAQDLALTMEVIGKPCLNDSTSLPRQASFSYTRPISGLKIGVPWELLKDLPREMQDNFLSSLEVYKSLGCEVVEVDLKACRHAIAIYYILATAEASTNLARFDGVRYGIRSKKGSTVDDLIDESREEGFGKEVKRRILLGTYVLSAGYQDAYYKKAQKARSVVIQEFKRAFEKCNVIATPTTTSPAFELGKIQDPLEMYLQDLLTIPANLAGLPALSLPSGFTAEGKPLSLQITAPPLEDSLVLSFAHHFGLATSFHLRAPNL